MEARAKRKYIRSSPLKMRRVINTIRGERVSTALEALHFMPQAATRAIELTIRSAVHNLMDKHQDERFDEGDLVIADIRVDEGPTFRRFRPAPRGRAHPYRKRLSHLTVVVRSVDDLSEET